jgi:hypothetical protein
MSNKPSIDELLAAVTQADSKKRIRIENNANTLRYISEMKLEPGTKAVPNFVIFWHYRQIWEGSDNRWKVNKIVFFRTFSKKFPSHRIGKQRFYLLKDDCIEINDKILEEAKLYDKKYVRFKKKTETEEGKQEISSDSPGDETP